MGREVGLSLDLSPEGQGPPAPHGWAGLAPRLLQGGGLWGFLAGVAVVFPRVSAAPGEWPWVPWGDPGQSTTRETRLHRNGRYCMPQLRPDAAK